MEFCAGHGSGTRSSLASDVGELRRGCLHQYAYGRSLSIRHAGRRSQPHCAEPGGRLSKAFHGLWRTGFGTGQNPVVGNPQCIAREIFHSLYGIDSGGSFVADGKFGKQRRHAVSR